MKISQEQKVEIRRKLLSAAVELFTEKGFGGATMREISKLAGCSPGTVYNYFPTKEAIFYAYFEEKQDELFRALAEIEDFEALDLKEKLQAMMEAHIEVYTPDREFVEIVYRALLDSPMKSYTELRPLQARFADEVGGYFAVAVEKGQIAPQPFGGFLANLVWDYKNLTVLYWLKDTSAEFVNTTRLIDMSLDIFVDIIKSNLITKTADILSFLVRSHLFGNVDKMFRLVTLVTEAGAAAPWGRR